MAKKSKQDTHSNVGLTFIHFLKQNASLSSYIEQIQKFSVTVERKLSIEDCLRDLHTNFAMLNSRAFLALQTQRLANTTQHLNDEQRYQQFLDILAQDIVVSAQSREILDPHCKSEQDYSSAIAHYKKWLVNVLFLVLIFHPMENFKYTDDVLIQYLLFCHEIYNGETISKVKLRSAARIDADIVSELSRSIALRVHSHLTNEHWAYVSLADESGLKGYLPVAYIKVYK